MSLTSKQRAALRGMANTMEPVFQIGKGEIDETLIKGVDDCIKVADLHQSPRADQAEGAGKQRV